MYTSLVSSWCQLQGTFEYPNVSDESLDPPTKMSRAVVFLVSVVELLVQLAGVRMFQIGLIVKHTDSDTQH